MWFDLHLFQERVKLLKNLKNHQFNFINLYLSYIQAVIWTFIKVTYLPFYKLTLSDLSLKLCKGSMYRK
jgi:hypothetical protein